MVVSGMSVLTSICCVALAVSAAEGAGCDVHINGDIYREENLVTGIGRAFGLAIDYTTNQLYFSYQSDNKLFPAKADLGTGEVRRIEELNGLCRFAINRVRDEVHAACLGNIQGLGGGLFQFDSHPDKFVPAGEPGLRIECIFYKDVLYYSFYDWLLVYKFHKGHRVRVPDLQSQVRGLVIDKHGDWIFHNDTGLYRQQSADMKTIRYAALSFTQVVAVDGSGNVYVCDWGRNHGIYRLHGRKSTATKIIDVKVCTGLAFDRDDNVIYSNDTRIVRLVKC